MRSITTTDGLTLVRICAVLLVASGGLVGCDDGGGASDGGGSVDGKTVDGGSTPHDGGTADAHPRRDASRDAGADAVAPCPSCPAGEMVAVPAGPFQMGCNAAVDTECESSELPYHAVNVPAFEIDKYEVTVAEYQACVDAFKCLPANLGGPCDTNYGVVGRESHPINCINYGQARNYCLWLGKRLPTEAEWEKAARGTDGRKFPWGNGSADCGHAKFKACGTGTAPVGSRPSGASFYGAEDMAGNVSEFVADRYHFDYAGAPTDGSAWVTDGVNDLGVVRGGAWTMDPQLLRASARLDLRDLSLASTVGFRCARN